MILIVSSLCMVQKCQPLQQPLLESWDLPGSLSDALVEWTSDPGSNMHLPVFTWPGRETLSVRTCLGWGRRLRRCPTSTDSRVTWTCHMHLQYEYKLPNHFVGGGDTNATTSGRQSHSWLEWQDMVHCLLVM
jgi:hypothetical protein